jgi:hypothetical protein
MSNMHPNFPLTFTINRVQREQDCLYHCSPHFITHTSLYIQITFIMTKMSHVLYSDCRVTRSANPDSVYSATPCSLYLQAQSHSYCTGWPLFNKSHLTWAGGSIFRTTLLACFVNRTFDLPHPRYQCIMYVIRLVKSVGANLDTSLR